MITTKICKRELNKRVPSKCWKLIRKYSCMFEENCKICIVREFSTIELPEKVAFVFEIDNEVRKIDVIKEKKIPLHFEFKYDFLEQVRTRPWIKKKGIRSALGFDEIKVSNIIGNFITIWHRGINQPSSYVTYRYFNNGRFYAVF